MKFRKLLKIFNPIIKGLNLFMYMSHLEGQRNNSSGYDPYDFSKDIKHF